MKCLRCQFDNPPRAKFCNACGGRLGIGCPACGTLNPSESHFCNECGHFLTGTANKSDFKGPSPRVYRYPTEVEERGVTFTEKAGERKYVTVLFSDLTGYTAMSEQLDPEEVREIMSRIFGEIAQIVMKYDGFIEKFVGDAVMALFGVKKAYEDDPIRAIRAAREIHQRVQSLSRNFESRIGHPLSMHTGINTGLVVTGEVNFEKGTHGVSGDTINLASRLSSMGEAGDILVGPETYRQARGYFNLDALEPVHVKGKTEPVRIFRVVSMTDRPRKIHRFHGVRADMIGRKLEMALLHEAVRKLKNGKGSIFSIRGNAGTGKSRLIEEFKSSLDLDRFQWREGQCYPYSQNITYFPLIDLLNRGLNIEEGDPAELVRQKIETGLDMIDKKEDVVPYVGSLYNLSYRELEGISPEIWKIRLQKAIQEILTTLAQYGPIVICLEDLHWSDPSSLDLIRFLVSNFRYPALVLCVYRPTLTLLSGHQINQLGDIYQEIQLDDLSPSETQDMVQSLLQTDSIPPDLQRFLREKVDGNPFYLEEVINSLIESETLIRENGRWVLQNRISESEISPTVHGVIASRLDRLDKEMKRILQEASVIGRAFYYDILSKISELKGNLEYNLSGLEHLDLIKTRSFQPHLEFMFKHALTQEVVYNGLLKKERKVIHERIGTVIEQLFQDRMPEYYETLAFHFKRGQSVLKAVEYLSRSGKKSLGRYALEESHRYYQDAYNILSPKIEKSDAEQKLLIDLINQWSFVFYYRGNYKELLEILNRYKATADDFADKDKRGMFYAWLGCALWHRENFKEAHRFLTSALKLGEETRNYQLIGYACAWNTWVCTELGLMEDAISYAERAQRICKLGDCDQYIYFNSLAGMGYALWHQGETPRIQQVGKTLLEFGRDNSDDRIIGMGYCCMGWSYLAAGDLAKATSALQKAVKVSVDPWYSVFPKLALSYGLILNGKIKEAQQYIEEVLAFSQGRGAEFAEQPALFFQGIVWVTNGQVSTGLEILEEKFQTWMKNDSKLRATACGFILATVYAHIAQNAAALNQEKLAPVAGKKAVAYFRHSIESAKAIGAKGVLGQAYLYLGLMSKDKGNTDQAGKYFSRSINYFRQCNADIYLRQATEALASLAT